MTLDIDKTHLTALKNKPSEFLSLLINAWRDEHLQNRNTPETAALIIDLCKNEKIDFCALCLRALDEKFAVFDIIYLLEKTLPYFDMNEEVTIELLEKLYEGTQNDLAAFKQYEPANKLVETQPQFSKKLLAQLIEADRPFVVGYIAHLYITFSKGNEHEIHKELDDLSSNESALITCAVINALGNLDYEPAKNRTLLKRTYEIFDKLEQRNVKEIDACTSSAYGRLLKVDQETVVEKLEIYSNKNTPDVDWAISEILFRNTKENGNSDWFAKLLMPLAKTICQHKGIIDNLDYILSDLIKRNNNWPLAENFFVRWLEESDYVNHKDKLADLYNSTLAAFAKDRENLEKLITKLFNNDSYKMHLAASEIISFCNLYKLQTLRLDKSEISKLEYEDLLFVGRKILGYVIDSKTQCSLIFSLLEKSPRNKKLRGLVYTILSEYVGQDYPRATEEFLTKEISGTKSKNKREVAEAAIKDIKKYHDSRNSLPRLKETLPPTLQTRQIALEQRKIMSKTMEEAQKGSIVNLFAKIQMKYGSGSFSFHNNDYMPISKLSSFSEYMELPTSEISHPVSAAIDRAGFRQAKRGD